MTAQETATNPSLSPVGPNQGVALQGRQEQISAFPFVQHQLHLRRRLPSIAYFMSRANRFHMISALILPTFSSCGNLECNEREFGLESPSLQQHASHRVAWRPELQQTTDVQEDMPAGFHYSIIPHLPTIISETGWIRAERCVCGGIEKRKMNGFRRHSWEENQCEGYRLFAR